MRGAFDWTRDQLRKHAYKGCVFNKMFLWFTYAPIDVDGVTQCLEGIKADSDREYESKCIWVERKTETVCGDGETGGKPVKIFEDKQNR